MTTLSLTQMIADLNAKIAAADSSTSVATLLEYATEAEKLGGGTNIYDSAGVLPSDSAYEGSIAYIASDAELRVKAPEGWGKITDSAFEAYHFGGDTAGYTAGGQAGPSAVRNEIDRFSFTSDENATDVGDLAEGRHSSVGNQSKQNAYVSGGINSYYYNNIQKFPLAATADATDIADLAVNAAEAAPQSSETNGYISGGMNDDVGMLDNIQKFPFASDDNTTDIANLSAGVRPKLSGQSSTTNGYTAGGRSNYGGGASYVNTINKFPFSTDTDASDIANLTATSGEGAGQSSSTHGYKSGGLPGSNVIEKFSFSTDGNATDVGDLTVGKNSAAGHSSESNGYRSGGDPAVNIIDKFPFSTDANATDVGDLLQSRRSHAGVHQ